MFSLDKDVYLQLGEKVKYRKQRFYYCHSVLHKPHLIDTVSKHNLCSERLATNRLREEKVF